MLDNKKSEVCVKLAKYILLMSLVILGIMLFYPAGALADDGNIMVNPSFEQGSGPIPFGWTTWQWDTGAGVTEFRVEEGDAHSGNRFVTIINNKENDARLKQVVKVEENTIYRVSCRIRATNVGADMKGANISIEGRLETSRDIRGTNEEWEETELYIKTGENVESVVLTIGLGGYGNINTGRASFDSVVMEKAPSIPAGAPVANIEAEAARQSSDKKETDGAGERPFWLMFLAAAAAAGAYLHYKKNRGKVPGEKQSQVNGVPAKQAPSKELSEKEIPAKGVLVKEVSAKEISAKGVLANEVSAKEIPVKGILANEVPTEQIPANKKTVSSPTQAPVPSRPGQKKVDRTDYIIMGVMTLIYLVIALINLGSLSVPETGWNPVFPGEGCTIVFPERKALSRISYFCARGTGWDAKGSYEVEYRDENGEYKPLVTLEKDNIFVWKYTDISVTTDSLKIMVDSPGGALNEICIFEKGSKTPVTEFEIVETSFDPSGSGSPEKLFDEQDRYAWIPTYLNGTYFDEIYHARTAYEHIHGIEPFENTHPPLGKIFIALGILVFGMNPFGWRIAGTLFGVAMIPVMYMFGKKIFGDRFLSFCAAFLMMFDFMHFTQSRIATIDVYVTFFVILMFCFMYDYFVNKSYEMGFRNSLKPLFLSGLFFGLGAASKWIAIYGAAGLALLFFFAKYREYRDYKRISANRRAAVKTPWLKDFVPFYINRTILACFIFFVLIPLVIYVLSYIPFMCVDGPGHGLKNVISLQKHMYNYHSGLKAEHSFSSKWWQWPVMTRPVWYFSGAGSAAGRVSSIAAFGNPAVWWVGIPAFFAAIIIAIKNRDRRMTVVFTAVMAQYLPWILVPRIAFIYHYFSIVPFIILCIVYVINHLIRLKPEAKHIVYGYLALVLVLFIMFYPVLSGMEVSTAYIGKLKWLKTWIF
jgi:dolichyl-phosphate-mannose-protein mannosyltransferase